MSESIAFQQMIDAATAYFLAAERCVPDLAFGSYPRHSVNSPVLTNYAFSVEIALKILLLHNDIEPPKTHNLRKLFDCLPHGKRDFLKVFSENTTFAGYGDSLTEVSNYFVDWRYAYQKDYLFGSHDEIRRIFIACYQEIRRVRPTLVSIYEQNWGKFEPNHSWAWYEEETRSYRERYG